MRKGTLKLQKVQGSQKRKRRKSQKNTNPDDSGASSDKPKTLSLTLKVPAPMPESVSPQATAPEAIGNGSGAPSGAAAGAIVVSSTDCLGGRTPSDMVRQDVAIHHPVTDKKESNSNSVVYRQHGYTNCTILLQGRIGHWLPEP